VRRRRKRRKKLLVGTEGLASVAPAMMALAE
jgi:hypothetical protein